MQFIIDDDAEHVRDLFDHFLSLNWQVALNDRPRVFSCFLEGKCG